MEQSNLQRAVIEAMQDPKVIAEFAIAVSKKIIDQKLKTNSDEDLYVRNHIVFAEAGDPDGTFMIAKEIEDSILEINPEFEIKTRLFGKALLAETKETKQTSKGRAYFIKAIVSDMKDYAEGMEADEIVDKANSDDPEEEEKPKKDKKKDKDKKSKKDKNSDSDEATEEEKELPKKTTEEAFEKPEVDVQLLIAACEGSDTLLDYKLHLESFSRNKLIKHINEFKMPLIVTDLTEDEIIDSIINLLRENLPEDEPVSEEVEEKSESKKSKKDKKKDKKSIKLDELVRKPIKKDKKKKKK